MGLRRLKPLSFLSTSLSRIDTLEESIGSGDGWEELDLSNLPTDFETTDMIFVKLHVTMTLSTSITDWNTNPGAGNASVVQGESYDKLYALFSLQSADMSTYVGIPIEARFSANGGCFGIMCISIRNITDWNSSNASTIFTIFAYAINGSGFGGSNESVNRTNITNYVERMWRKRM